MSDEPRYVLDDEPDAQGPFITKSGRVLTDDDINAMADEAERGYAITVEPKHAAMVAESLQQRQEFWRARMGDEDYQRALAHWRALASG